MQKVFCSFKFLLTISFKSIRHIMVAIPIRELLQRLAIYLICQLHLNGQELLNHRINCLAEVCAYCKRTEGQNYQRQGRNKHSF